MSAFPVAAWGWSPRPCDPKQMVLLAEVAESGPVPTSPGRHAWPGLQSRFAGLVRAPDMQVLRDHLFVYEDCDQGELLTLLCFRVTGAEGLLFRA